MDRKEIEFNPENNKLLDDDTPVDHWEAGKLKDLVNTVLRISGRDGNFSERSHFDFKEKLNILEGATEHTELYKYKLRKTFASLQNNIRNKVSWLFVGISDNGKPTGYELSKKQMENIRLVLSERSKIHPAVNFHSDVADINGLNVLVFQIHQLEVPIKVWNPESNKWEWKTRELNTTRYMDTPDFQLWSNAKNLPLDYNQLEFEQDDQLGIYDIDSKKISTAFEIDFPKELKQEFQSKLGLPPYSSLVLIPLSAPDVNFSGKLYRVLTPRQQHIEKDRLDIAIKEVFGCLEAKGIVYDSWGVTTKLSDGKSKFFVGMGTEGLSQLLDKNVPSKFGWYLFAGGAQYIISGATYDDHCVVSQQIFFKFIPTDKKVPIITGNGLVNESFPNLVEHTFEQGLREWENIHHIQTPMKYTHAGPVPDSVILGKTKVLGYAGMKPRERDIETWRARQITVFSAYDLDHNAVKKDFGYGIRQISKVVGYLDFRNAKDFDDSKEFDIVSWRVRLFPLYDHFSELSLVFHESSLGVYQEISSQRGFKSNSEVGQSDTN